MGFDELSTRLWRERCVLELLRFKLAEEHLILASGHHGWLDRATAEVEQVVAMLELADAEREESVQAVASLLGLTGTPTLADLAGAAPEPWGEILAGHRRAMVEHFEQIEKVSTANREILARRMAATADALAYLGAQPSVAYGANGAPNRSRSRADARLVNATA
jgi:hypothetical protein